LSLHAPYVPKFVVVAVIFSYYVNCGPVQTKYLAHSISI